MSYRRVSVEKSRHRHLLSGPEVKRWYDNVARGSIITADVYLRRLGLFCEKNNITPKTLVEMDKTSLTALALDNVTRLEAKATLAATFNLLSRRQSLGSTIMTHS